MGGLYHQLLKTVHITLHTLLVSIRQYWPNPSQIFKNNFYGSCSVVQCMNTLHRANPTILTKPLPLFIFYCSWVMYEWLISLATVDCTHNTAHSTRINPTVLAHPLPDFSKLSLWVLQCSSVLRTLYTGQIRQYWPLPLPLLILYCVWVMYELLIPVYTLNSTLHTLLG